MNNAVITGGAGFIASHLAKALKNKYDKIYLIDSLVRTSNLRNIKSLLKDENYVFIEADVADFDFNSLPDIKELYHLAAIRINRCVQFPAEGHKSIADSGMNIVRYCTENNVKLFFASTASVYNNPKTFPIMETDPCEPHTIYGAGKYYTEGLIRSFAKTHNLTYSICRFFSVYGPNMDCEGAYTEIVYNWLNSVNTGSNEITVYGNPDEKILDLVYVEDVVNAIVTVTENWTNDVFNVSTEEGISISELIRVIEKELEVSLNLRILPENRTDIENKRVGSVSKLKKLGWNSNYTISQGIKKTYQWIQTL